MLQHYNTKIGFGEIFTSAQQFYDECAAADIPLVISEANCKALFYLLYAEYGNNHIPNLDETQWKYRIFTTIYTYGGEWQKKLAIQTKLKDLDLDSADLYESARSIYNSALNPETAPQTSEEELAYINSQNTTKHKRGKLEGLDVLWSSLDSNINRNFLEKFKKACMGTPFANPDITALYWNEFDDE